MMDNRVCMMYRWRVGNRCVDTHGEREGGGEGGGRGTTDIGRVQAMINAWRLDSQGDRMEEPKRNLLDSGLEERAIKWADTLSLR